MGWLVLFGVLPALIGWRALRGGSDHGGGGRAAAIALSLLALFLAPMAAMPPRGSTSALVVFAPGTATADRFDAVLAADARLLWTRPDGRMMAVALQDGSASRLYADGALIVTRSAAFAGCMAALQT